MNHNKIFNNFNRPKGGSKMKKIITFFFVLLISQISFSQIQEWAYRFNYSSLENRSNDIALDADGNIYITGNADQKYYVTLKYSPSGTRLWHEEYGSENNRSTMANGIVVNADGDVYITGEFGIETEPPNDNIVTIKYNSAGVQQWVHTWDRGFNDWGRNIAIDPEGNLYVIGLTAIFFNNDGVIFKLSPNGELLHQDIFDFTNQEDPRLIAIDNDGNICVCSPTGLPGAMDILLLKYSPDLDRQWAEIYDGGGDDYPSGMAINSQNEIFITGESANNNGNFITLKYLPDGNRDWVRHYDGYMSPDEAGRDIAIDGSDNVYVTGYTAPSGYHDVTTLMYSPDGNLKWAADFTNTMLNFDAWGKSMAIGNDGNIYITGEYQTREPGSDRDILTIKYSPRGNQEWYIFYDYNHATDGSFYQQPIAVDANNNVIVTSQSELIPEESDIVTIKYSQSGDKPNLISQNNNHEPSLKNYPNPFNPATTIEFELQRESNVNLKVYDFTGRELTVLLNEHLGNGKHSVKWNASNYASGIYFYVLKTESFTDTKKMLLIK
jgi:uncharacterized delta-60 repeat protein